jgi:peptidoglycan/xylan/chitin deacetylase (PgdA/CDA1 family)
MWKWWILLIISIVLTGCIQSKVTEEVPNKKTPSSETKDQDNREAPPSEMKKPNENPNAGIDSPDESDPQNKEDEKVDSESVYIVNPKTWTIEPINEAKSNTILLTIDDAPDQYALEMATMLKKLEVPSIFFVNGHFISSEEEKQVLKDIYDLGFSIGNHTSNHKNLSKLTAEQQKQEILSLSQQIEKIIGEKPKFFRAPFGVNTGISNQIVKDAGMLAMNWTYGYDWEAEYQNKEGLEDIMVNTPLLHDGAILLMHDRKWTLEALEGIIEGLKEKGYEFVDPQEIRLN